MAIMWSCFPVHPSQNPGSGVDDLEVGEVDTLQKLKILPSIL